MRARVFAFALLAAPLTAWWTVDQGVDMIFSLMVPPVMVTVGAAILNLAWRRATRRPGLSAAELVVFFGMQTVVGALCAEWMSVINPYIYSYALYRSGNSHMDKYVNPYASHWFFVPVKDAPLFQDFRNGGLPFWYFLGKLHLWWKYIASWTLLIGLVCTAMLAINSLMLDEWTRRERLAFPIIQVPLAVAEAGAGRLGLLRSRPFLLAFAIMFVIDIENGFHYIYPSMPLINVRFLGNMTQWFASPPWNTVGWTPIGIFPYLAVIGFFMPTDLLFSCIFFFFFRKGMQVATYAIGYTDSAGTFGGGGLVPSPPYFSEQSWGAFLALFVTAMLVARPYLRESWAKIVRGDRPEPGAVGLRTGFAVLVASIGGILWISYEIGMPMWMAVSSLALFLMFSVALTRLRAQLGAPSHEMAFMGPNQMIADFAGTNHLAPDGVSRLVTMTFYMNRIHRAHPMPHQLEAMKMGAQSNTDQRKLFIAILCAVVVGSVLGHLAYILHGYHFTPNQAGDDTADVTAQLVEQRRPPNTVAIAAVLVGFTFVLLLDFIRFRVPGFPLHPAGYALAMNFGLDYFWFGLIIVWMVKVFVERYYGLRGHGKLHEAAIGIILAEFSAEAIWSIYAMCTRTATYSISINGRLGWNQ